MTIKIHLADDHAMFRSGLKALVETEEDLVVVGETGKSFDTLMWFTEYQADVLVLDINMPGPPTSKVARDILADHPKIALLILTVHSEEYYLRQFLQLGAKGFMVKTSTGNQFIQAIRTIHRGKTHIDPILSEHLVSYYVGRPLKSGDRLDLLTNREQEVCTYLAMGHTGTEVARVLSISTRTVETHRATIMTKLELKSRAELVRFALENGLLKA
jgi:DNA-binding NarL/FixJ family response regulator